MHLWQSLRHEHSRQIHRHIHYFGQKFELPCQNWRKTHGLIFRLPQYQQQKQMLPRICFSLFRQPETFAICKTPEAA